MGAGLQGQGGFQSQVRAAQGLRWGLNLALALAAVLSVACTCASPILPSRDQPHPHARFQKSLGLKQAGVEGEGGKRRQAAVARTVCLCGNCTLAPEGGTTPT